jgi:hypothetical protein
VGWPGAAVTAVGWPGATVAACGAADVAGWLVAAAFPAGAAAPEESPLAPVSVTSPPAGRQDKCLFLRE